MINRYWISLLVILSLGILPLHGQIIVNMERDGGVYKVPCSVNGVKMKFIFDTGASVVSLSKSMATYMEDNGYLNKKDYLGKSQTIIADGSVVDVEVVNLRDFEIGGLHLKDVVATVKDGQNVPLLMGQSAIEKLGRVSIEKGRLIIHQTNANLTASQIADLRKEIERYVYLKQYESAVDRLALLRRATKLTGEDYYNYAWALSGCEDYDQLISIGKDWEASGVETGNYYKGEILSDIAFALSMTGSPSEAIRYYQKALPFRDDYLKGSAYAQIAYCYDDLNNKYQTEYYIKQALSSRYTFIQQTIADVIAGGITDGYLGAFYWQYALFEEKYNKDYSQRDFYLRLSAKCGYQRAIDFCFENNINYTR